MERTKHTRESIYNIVASNGLLDQTWQKETASATIDAIGTIIATMEDGDSLELRGVGVFRATFKNGKRFHNVHTGKIEESEGRIQIKFTPSKKASDYHEDDDVAPTTPSNVKPRIPVKVEDPKSLTLTDEELSFIDDQVMGGGSPLKYVLEEFPLEKHALVTAEYYRLKPHTKPE